MEDCLFCKIAAKQIPADVVYEDENTLAFLDVNPRAPGHTIIIPKSHRETILDLPEKETSSLFSAVKIVADAVSGALHADGLNIGINHKPAGGQVVNHLHVHILPRFIGDGGTSVQGIVNNPPKDSLKEICKKIKSFRN
ncbi:MAG: HIT family protein [Patescibacteria group bacterium]|nr:HIT family protein [Patescibacteria group bacterium]MDE2015378.1 HIT family protein [Patescibacteria group bacterium]MDE2227007.1 HIT family protein [Patescibacteria group bacterium]